MCFVLFVYRCDLAIRESAQLGSSSAARTLATVSVTVTTYTSDQNYIVCYLLRV